MSLKQNNKAAAFDGTKGIITQLSDLEVNMQGENGGYRLFWIYDVRDVYQSKLRSHCPKIMPLIINDSYMIHNILTVKVLRNAIVAKIWSNSRGQSGNIPITYNKK